MSSSSAKLLSGFHVADLFQLSTLFLSIIKAEDLRDCLSLCNFLIFVLNPLLSKSTIGEPKLLAGILRLIQKIWVISLLHILVIKFSVARSWILFQPSLLLEKSSFLRNIVRITLCVKHIPFVGLPTRILSSQAVSAPKAVSM